MGLLSSLFAGVSGLNAQGNALSVIGNNIANMSTVGFKSSQSTFADLISSSLGGGASAIQTGIGVALVGVQGNFSQGSLTTTTNALDMAIDGNGFFVLNDSQGGSLYSRAGQFRLNSSNEVVDPNGFKLQGFQADTTGTITGTISDVTLPSTTASPRATAAITIGANLSSQATTSTFSITDPTGTSNFSTSMSVYDSLGISHLLTVYFTKTAANTWAYNVTAPSADITVANYNAANIDATLGIVRVASGTLGFT